MKLTTRQIVVAGVLLAVALVLAFTGLGYFPVPNVSDSATIMHVPPIIGALLEGPVVGVIVGLVFAIDAYIRFGAVLAGAPAFLPFVVLLLPRLCVPLGAWFTYRALKGMNEYVAVIVGAIAGALTNTVLVVGLLLIFWSSIPVFQGLTQGAFVASVIPQATFEAVLSAIVTVAVVAAWKRIEGGRGKSFV